MEWILSMLVCVAAFTFASPPKKKASSAAAKWELNEKPAPISVRVVPDRDGARADTSAASLRSLKEARDFLRAKRTAGELKSGALVTFADGVYPISEAIEFMKEDSGTKEHPIIYRAEHPGKARFVGEVTLDWHPIMKDDPHWSLLPEVARTKVFVADMPGTAPLPGFLGGGIDPKKESECPFSVFADGERLTLARFPKKELLRVAHFHGKRSFAGECVGTITREGVFDIDSPRLGDWAREPELWAHGYWVFLWRDMASRVLKVDPIAKTMAVDTNNSIGIGFQDNSAQFFVFNALSELDEPGYWAIDRRLRRFYVWPKNGAKARIHVAAAEHLIKAKGLSDVAFTGFTAEYTRDAAIIIEDARRVDLTKMTIRHVTGWGVLVKGGTSCSVRGCDLNDLGGGGVSLDGGDERTLTSAGHVVDNCHIDHFALVIHNGSPGVRLNGFGSRATHNLIHHTHQCAITFNGNDHYIGYNVVHDTCMNNKDAGAIYCCQRDWTKRGTVIAYNFVHANGIQPAPKETPGIYLDDWSSGIVVCGNIVSCASAGIWVCGGNGNLVERNIMMNLTDNGISLSSRGADSFAANTARQGRESRLYAKVEKNALYKSDAWLKHYPDLLKVFRLEDPVFAHNALYNTIVSNVVAATPTVYKRRNWVAIKDYTVLDETAQVVDDPGFVNAREGDFNLRPGSMVQDLLGTTHFDAMGLYDSPERVSPAVKFGADHYPFKGVERNDAQ